MKASFHAKELGSIARSFAWRGLLTGLLLLARPARADESAGAELPLKASDNGRYLADQKGAPFLVVGDTAWSMIAQLEDQDIALYLDDRKKRGFNSIIVNLLEHKFSSKAPANRLGQRPFKVPGDFSTPNPAYFDYAYDVIEQANDRGIVVWLAPAYLGYGGGDEGFFKEIKAGGREKLFAYGRFLAERFGDLPNLVWMLGGDYTPEPSDRWTITELAQGIRSGDTTHLITAHLAPEKSAAAIFGKEPWLTLDTVYSYEAALFRPLLAEYELAPPRPCVLIETTYEGEHKSTPSQIRRQAYWAMLGGACGQFFGNNPIWHFDGPGLFHSPLTWRQALAADGSRDMAHLARFFKSVPWFDLVPDAKHALLKGGLGTSPSTALAARTRDGKTAVVYAPSTGVEVRVIKLDLSSFKPPVAAQWFSPATGKSATVNGAPLPASESVQLRSPGNNGAGANDWLLLLTAHD